MKYFLIAILLMCTCYSGKCQDSETAILNTDELLQKVGSSRMDTIKIPSDTVAGLSRMVNMADKKFKRRYPLFKDDTIFNKQRFYTIAAATSAALVGTYIYSNKAWWAGQKTDFHFDGGYKFKDLFSLGNDARYAKSLDKFGHFYGGHIAGDLFSQAVRWSGKSEKASLVWGGVFGTLVEGFIEIKDGFSPNWGFSMYDWMAGSLGSFYPYLQSRSRFLKALDVKYSYYKRDDYYFQYRYKSSFQDDYMNQTFWFTFNPRRYKPDSKWPKWLGVSAGFGVDNKLNDYYIGYTAFSYENLGHGGYEFFIAPDIDFTGLLPKKLLWQRIGKLLNYIKFPAPTLRLSNDSRVFLLYF